MDSFSKYFIRIPPELTASARSVTYIWALSNIENMPNMTNNIITPKYFRQGLNKQMLQQAMNAHQY